MNPEAQTPMPEMAQPQQAAPAMASEEQRQQLMDLIEATRTKIAEVNTAKFSSENAGEVARSEALKEVFMILQQAGVDLTDPQSVNQYLSEIRQLNPEMAQLFEDSLNQLLGGEGPKATEEASQPNMMNNETIPEDVRGQVPPQQQGSQLG